MLCETRRVAQEDFGLIQEKRDGKARRAFLAPAPAAAVFKATCR